MRRILSARREMGMDETLKVMDYSLIPMKPPPSIPLKKAEGFPGQRIVVLPRKVIQKLREHPLLQGLLVTDAGFFPKASGHYFQRRAGIDQMIFIYCANGGGWCEMGGGRHEVRPGELLIIPPGMPHTYGANENQAWTIHWFHVIGRDSAALQQEFGAALEQPVLYLGQSALLLALFAEMLEVIERGYAPANVLYATQTLTHLIGAMIWHRHENWRGEPDLKHKIAQSISFMKQRLASPLTVPRLAALTNLSASHYTALFKKQTGYAPLDYFIRLRMHQACQLLDTTSLEVKEIAAQLGYDDPFYFSRLFRRINEMSPVHYRLKRKG